VNDVMAAARRAEKQFRQEMAKTPQGERKDLAGVVRKLQYVGSRTGGGADLASWLKGYHMPQDAGNALPWLLPFVQKRYAVADHDWWHSHLYPSRRRKPLPEKMLTVLPLVGKYHRGVEYSEFTKAINQIINSKAFRKGMEDAVMGESLFRKKLREGA
jgi:hypothetical protein